MSLARSAVHGAMWTVATSLLARLIGLGGTIVIAHYLTPTMVGEVNAAAILIATGDLLTNFGLGNYYIVKGDRSADVAFHMSLYSTVLGLVGFGVAWLLTDFVSEHFNFPTMGQYMPGLIGAWLIRRTTALPNKLLARDMRFGRIGIASTCGELVFVGTSIVLAFQDFGGHALVWGNVAQAIAEFVVTASGVPLAAWLKPHKLSWARTKDMFRFGTPLGLTGLIGYVSSSWDRMIYSYFFGAQLAGLFHYGAKLASIPAAQVGEQIADVLLPSMSQLPPSSRPRALIRSTALMGILLFPLALGLAAVADSLVHAIFPEKWHGTAPLVTILCAISLFQPISRTVGAFLISQERTRTMVVLQIIKTIALVAGMALFSLLGPLWICAGVAFSYAVHSLAGSGVCVSRYQVPIGGFLRSFLQPLLACVPMVAAVLGVRYGLRAIDIHSPVISLLVEIVAGAVVYVPSAFVCAPSIARDFVQVLSNAVKRSSPAPSDDGQSSDADQ